MKIPAPKRVIVESSIAEGAMVASLKKNLPEAHFEIVDRISDMTRRDPEILEVVDFRGKFLKSCPGTRHYHCCGYRILHFGTQCSLDCSYCILQAYLNQPNLRLFGNLDDLFRELSEALAQDKRSLHRMGPENLPILFCWILLQSCLDCLFHILPELPMRSLSLKLKPPLLKTSGDSITKATRSLPGRSIRRRSASTKNPLQPLSPRGSKRHAPAPAKVIFSPFISTRLSTIQAGNPATPARSTGSSPQSTRPELSGSAWGLCVSCPH